MKELKYFMHVHGLMDERSFLQRLSPTMQWILIAAALLSLLIGSGMKFFIYKHILHIRLVSRPINILILIEQLIHHLFGWFSIPWVIIWLTTNTTAAQMLEILFR